MWFTFLAACATALAILYVPGFLLLMPARSLAWSDRFADAPLVCMAWYGVAAIIYPILGIQASLVTLVMPLTLSALIILAVRLLHLRSDRHSILVPLLQGLTRSDFVSIVAYVVAGILLTTMVFVKNLDGASSFFQAYDNGNHLNMVRVFLETGNFSSFNSSAYAVAGTIAPFTGTPGFYPAAWHLLVALVVSITDAPITLGVNAVNAMLLGAVFPLSMCALLSRLFGQESRLVLFGSVVCLAFGSTVWEFVAFGPLYPMLMSYSLVPAATSCFIRSSDDSIRGKERIVHCMLFLAGCISIALSQPSGIFLMAVILASFLVWRVYSIAQSVFPNSRVKPAICSTITILAIVAIWMFCYNSSLFRDIVEFNWPADATLHQAVLDVVLLSMRDRGAQLLLAFFVGVGVIMALCDGKKRWLIASYFIAAFTYVVCVATEGMLKHVLGGFWYTDTHRLAVNVSIIATPFAVMGIDFVYRLIRLVFDWLAERLEGCPSGITVSGLAMLLSCAIIYWPSFTLRGVGDLKTSFGGLEESIEQQNDTQAVHVLDHEEIEFVEEALSLVPDGSLIINYANDGSGFLYALYGANMYYRNFALSASGFEETRESELIRKHLSEIVIMHSVQEAVDTIDANYVLLLDQGDSDTPRDFFWSNYPDQYPGLVSITDDTPGFNVLLSRGDMRLYEITY